MMNFDEITQLLFIKDYHLVITINKEILYLFLSLNDSWLGLYFGKKIIKLFIQLVVIFKGRSC